MQSHLHPTKFILLNNILTVEPAVALARSPHKVRSDDAWHLQTVNDHRRDAHHERNAPGVGAVHHEPLHTVVFLLRSPEPKHKESVTVKL